MKKYNIAVAGIGCVGLSLTVLLAQHNHVIAVDVVLEKVKMTNNKRSLIKDNYIEKVLADKEHLQCFTSKIRKCKERILYWPRHCLYGES